MATEDLALALDEILRTSQLNMPDDLPLLVAKAGDYLGSIETVMYVVDYEQLELLPLPVKDAPRKAICIEGSDAGETFCKVELRELPAGSSRRLWVSLSDGVERLGVMEFLIPTQGKALAEQVRTSCTRLAHLAAELLVTNSVYTDAYEWAKRQKPMKLAAEMQHSLLPPLTFGSRRVVISGLLAPAYEVGGDAFDYAVNGDTAHIGVFDAVGHGLQASVLANLAVSCYRNSRREKLSLIDTARAIDTVLEEMFGAERYVTAVLAQLDLDSGVLHWLNAGHPAPMLLRGAEVMRELPNPPLFPLGMNKLTGDRETQMSAQAIMELQLKPADRLLLITDGVDEARTEGGEFFGRARLAEFISRESAAGLPTPEMMRRLQHAILSHHKGDLQDDATTLFVEWLPVEPERLIP